MFHFRFTVYAQFIYFPFSHQKKYTAQKGTKVRTLSDELYNVVNSSKFKVSVYVYSLNIELSNLCPTYVRMTGIEFNNFIVKL